MSENATPLDLFKGWFRSQDIEVRTEIAFQVGSCLENMDLDALRAAPEQTFNAWLDRDVEKFRILGRVLSLRGLVDFLSFRGRATQEDWDKTIKRQKELLLAAEKKFGAGNVGPMRQSFESLPKRAKSWIRASTYWARLCKGGLSDERVDAWYLKTLMQK